MKIWSHFVVSDTTVQGNNTTFPTDAKLYKRIIDKCVKIAYNRYGNALTARRRFRRQNHKSVRRPYR